MSGNVSDRKRLISVTKGNLRNNHIYLTGHHDFFPAECYGGSCRAKGFGRSLTVEVVGLDEAVETDIASQGTPGSSANFLWKRK